MVSGSSWGAAWVFAPVILFAELAWGIETGPFEWDRERAREEAGRQPSASPRPVSSPLEISFEASESRASHTDRPRLMRRIMVTWTQGPARKDGKVPFYARAVKIYYAPDSRLDTAEARAWLHHRLESSLLAGGIMPSKENPRWLKPKRVEAEQSAAVDAIGEAVDESGSGFIEWSLSRQASAGQRSAQPVALVQ